MSREALSCPDIMYAIAEAVADTTAWSRRDDLTVDLKNMSLVSKDWQHPAQRRLFLGKTIKLSAPELAVLVNQESGVHGLLRRVEVTREIKLPHDLLNTVRLLSRLDNLESLAFSYSHPKDRPLVVATTMASVQLRSLQRLHLQSAPYRPSSLSFISAALSFVPHIIELYIDSDILVPEAAQCRSSINLLQLKRLRLPALKREAIVLRESGLLGAGFYSFFGPDQLRNILSKQTIAGLTHLETDSFEELLDDPDLASALFNNLESLTLTDVLGARRLVSFPHLRFIQLQYKSAGLTIRPLSIRYTQTQRCQYAMTSDFLNSLVSSLPESIERVKVSTDLCFHANEVDAQPLAVPAALIARLPKLKEIELAYRGPFDQFLSVVRPLECAKPDAS